MSMTQAHGKSTDATQEIITLGIGNIAGSFVGAMPISASFGRSAVQSSSGVRTPMVNVFSSEFSSPYPSLIHIWISYYNSHKQSFNVDLNAAFFSVLLHRRKEKGFLILDIYYLLGGVILLALGLLMPAFYYLPKAVLAAVVISSVMFLVEYEEIKPMWKSRSIHLMNQQIHLFIVLWVYKYPVYLSGPRNQCLEKSVFLLFVCFVIVGAIADGYFLFM